LVNPQQSTGRLVAKAASRLFFFGATLLSPDLEIAANFPFAIAD
jgi:hypothetical protein